MNLVPLVDFNDDPIRIQKLSSGLQWSYQEHLEGGGMLFRSSLLSAISKVGKQKYQRGFEWCSGAGSLGFELLGFDIADHMTFVDYYDKAIEHCIKTSEINEITDKVSAIVSSMIYGINVDYKWDLVIGNPPHSWNLNESRNSMKESGKFTSEREIENLCRLLVDDNMETHKDFFSEIRSRLTDSADIFIIEHDLSKTEEFKDMADKGGLYFVDMYECLMGEHDFGHKIFHFKVKI